LIGETGVVAGTRVYLEVGKKRVFACTLDWPGWCRSGKTEEDSLDALSAYAARYAPIAAAAGVRFPTTAARRFEVVQRMPGSASTDFGALDKPADADHTPLTKAQAERIAALVDAAWQYFDGVVATAPSSLRKGPRGGGRDRDKIVDHVIGAETSYIRKIELKFRQPAIDDATAIAEMRAATLDVLRTARAAEPDAPKGWPYRYVARRIAWHVLDHAWEIEDRSE
jgi:hypothetical protein